MSKKQKRDFLFTVFIFLPIFFILVSVTLPDSETIECKEGLISLNIENKSLETLVQKLGESCNINIFLDQNARNVLINAQIKSYPVEYAFSKILEGTGLNFIIYNNKLSEKPWTVFIGPTKGPGEQASYVEMKNSSSQSSARNSNYNPATSYQPPQPSRNENPQEKKPQQVHSSPSYVTNVSIPTAGSPQTTSNNETKSTIPTAGSPYTSPKRTSPSPTPPRRPDPYEHRRDPQRKQPEQVPIPEPTPNNPNNPVPPNTGSG
ncbi:MAG: hypothetical protein A2Y62_17245 [Candidatus Fischerbacteria bacterium RBG_13_37_8]|uniref:Secretin/TonB short N-terminal domain-containing protein n=1 Tax=Candidatus Fischerbacteria bacterium RBG_13_37_8 TaxID=1817863 RepID=A0A1F5VG02_9BACT|nr:MAG: hypothetical protein A2Y62_17245 [Candidatus Fischerbacteria bacterium RBG_13_37_8]